MALAAVGAQIGCLTLIIVFAALFIGRWLDQLFGTKPVILIALILGSVPVALFATFWFALNVAKKINPPPPTGTKSISEKEDR